MAQEISPNEIIAKKICNEAEFSSSIIWLLKTAGNDSRQTMSDVFWGGTCWKMQLRDHSELPKWWGTEAPFQAEKFLTNE